MLSEMKFLKLSEAFKKAMTRVGCELTYFVL